MTCNFCGKTFKRKKKTNRDRRFYNTYCDTVCFMAKHTRILNCAYCGFKFKDKGTKKRRNPHNCYCTRECYLKRKNPLPPLEIFGDPEAIEFMRIYREHKYNKEKL